MGIIHNIFIMSSHTAKPDAVLDFHRNLGTTPAVIEALTTAFLDETIHQNKTFLRIVTGNSAVAPRIAETVQKILSSHAYVTDIQSIDLENGMLHAIDFSIKKSA